MSEELTSADVAVASASAVSAPSDALALWVPEIVLTAVDLLLPRPSQDLDHGRTCAALQHARLHIACPNAAWAIPTPRDPEIRAMILAEIYRHTSNGQPAWNSAPSAKAGPTASLKPPECPETLA